MSGPPVKLVAIVNSFNRLQLLEPALTSLVQALGGAPCPSAVVAFEAGSTDGSIEWIEAFSARDLGVAIHLLKSDPGQSSSFSGGTNQAFAFARARYPDLEFILFFETDNWIASPKPLHLGIDLLRRQTSLAAVGFTVVRRDGAPAGYGCPFPTVPQFILGPHWTSWLKLDRPRAVKQSSAAGARWWFCDAVYTSPLLVRSSAWEQSGGLDEKMFPFSDSDIDWAWRLAKQGWKMAVIETHEVIHDNRGQVSAWSENRAMRFHRARLELLRRHRGSLVTWTKPLLALRHGAEIVLLAISPRASERRRELLKTRQALLRKVFENYE